MQPNASDLPWRISSFSGNGASCVEVAVTETLIKVRHSKDRAAGTLTFSPDEWNAFLAGVRHGEFDFESRASS